MTQQSGAQPDLEQRVSVLEEGMEMESGFRVGIERDLDTIKRRQVAQGQLLQAMHLNQAEHSGSLGRIETTVEKHSFVLAEHSTKLTILEMKMGGIETRMGTLETKMGTLETKVGTLESGMKELIGMVRTLIAREN